MCRRTPALDLERGLEPDAERGHHSRRAPEERDQRDEADRGEGRRDSLDRVRDVPLAGLRDRQDVDELVDDVLAQLVVLEDEPEDRDEDDREREEREQDVERDRRGVLRQPVAEEVLDRAR
jgi:hypothetical protein